jgi:hypothetical protein
VETGLSRNMSFRIGAAPTHSVGARRSLVDKGGIVSEGGLHDEQFASIKHGMVVKPPGARAHEQLVLVWSSQVDSRNDGLGARALGQICAYHVCRTELESRIRMATEAATIASLLGTKRASGRLAAAVNSGCAGWLLLVGSPVWQKIAHRGP